MTPKDESGVPARTHQRRPGLQVVELDQKLTVIQLGLGLGTQKRLADALRISTGAISKWKDTIPPLRLYDLARLIGIGEMDLASMSAQELAAWLRRPQAPMWKQVLARARSDLITLVHEEGSRPMPRLGPVRGVALEHRDRPRPPQAGAVFNIDDRIHLKLTVPWDFFGSSCHELHALVLLTDIDGTECITPLREPRLILRNPRMRAPHEVLIPERAPLQRFKLENPPGPHEFSVVFVEQPLAKIDAALLELIDPLPEPTADQLPVPSSDAPTAIAGDHARAKLTSWQLNTLGRLLDGCESQRWLVSNKGFYLNAG